MPFSEEQLKILAQRITLGEARKRVLQKALLVRIEEDAALRVGRAHRHSIYQGSSFTHLIKSLYLKPMPIIILLIIALAGGGTSFAAQGALPGDILYPVKINVNEEVQGTFAFSPEAKVAWETEKANRRLGEAATLTSENRLSENARLQLENQLNKNTDRVKVELKEIESNNPEEAADLASNFEVLLRAHGTIFNGIITPSASSSATTTAKFRLAITGAIAKAVEARVDAEDHVVAEGEHSSAGTKAAAEGKIGAATNVIASVRAFVEEKKSTLGALSVVSAEAKLQSADSLLADAKVKLDAGQFAEAFRLASQALRTANESRLTIETRGFLKLDADEKLDVDEESTSPTSTKMKEESEMKEKSETNVEMHGDGNNRSIEGHGDLKLNLGL